MWGLEPVVSLSGCSLCAWSSPERVSAGSTAALSLHAAGIDAIVIDSAASLRPLGVGINLMPHAVRELTELGLGERTRGDRHPHRGDGALRPARQPDLGLRQRPEHRLPLAAVLDSPRRAADDPARRGPGPARGGRCAHRDRFLGFFRVFVAGRGAGSRPVQRGWFGAAGRRAGRRGRAVLRRPGSAASGRAGAALGRHHDVARGDGGRAVPDRAHGRGRGHQRGAEVRRLPDLAAGRTAGPGAAQLGGRGHAARCQAPRRGYRRLEPDRARARTCCRGSRTGSSAGWTCPR